MTPRSMCVRIDDLGPYPGELRHVHENLDLDLTVDPADVARSPRWRVDVSGVPYGDGNRLARLARPSGLMAPVDVVLTCQGWPQRYIAKAWLIDLAYHIGPQLPGMPPLGRDEWLSFTLEGVGTARDIRPMAD